MNVTLRAMDPTDSNAYANAPLQFRPVYQTYPWGGRALATRLGRSIPEGTVAEAWEISDHPAGPTPVAGGPLAGKTLAELTTIYGLDLMGERNRAALGTGRFPLLVKLLDARQWLSVQVHPNDEYARAHENDLGKTEMWVVLDAQPGAELILGFRKGVTAGKFADALRDGRADRWLHRATVYPGDAFFVPPGTIHAIGPGTLLAEIQQSSNVTYRVYDWDRGSRPLHLDSAMEVLNFDAVELGPQRTSLDREANTSIERLAACPYFIVDRHCLEPGRRFQGICDGTTYEIWGLLQGNAEVSTGGGAVGLQPVSWTLLPATAGEYEILAADKSTLLRVFAPKSTIT